MPKPQHILHQIKPEQLSLLLFIAPATPPVDELFHTLLLIQCHDTIMAHS
jgi:hypothetical protein